MSFSFSELLASAGGLLCFSIGCLVLYDELRDPGHCFIGTATGIAAECVVVVGWTYLNFPISGPSAQVVVLLATPL